MNRYYLRCPECLTVSAIEAESLSITWQAQCGACHAQPLEHMGRVQRDRLIKEELRVPCDGRCTGATGPHCQCQCGGRNHGSHLLVTVQIDCGPIPVVTPLATCSARARAKEFRTLFNAVLENLPGKEAAERKSRGEWVSPGDFQLILKWRADRARLRQIEEMRSHPARIKALKQMRGPARPTPRQSNLFTEQRSNA